MLNLLKATECKKACNLFLHSKRAFLVKDISLMKYLTMLLKLSNLDSQSFVLHTNRIVFHQAFNGSIHMYGVVRYINDNVVWTQFMLTLTHYFEEFLRHTFVYFYFYCLNNCTKTMKISQNMRRPLKYSKYLS